MSWRGSDGEIFCYAPGEGCLPLGEMCPKGFAHFLSIGQNHAEDFAAANQAVVPAEVVVEQQIEGFRFASPQRLDGALLDFGFETAAAKGAFNAAIGIEEGLGANFLGAGAFDA